MEGICNIFKKIGILNFSRRFYFELTIRGHREGGHQGSVKKFKMPIFLKILQIPSMRLLI
jgi:hypothetical protein